MKKFEKHYLGKAKQVDGLQIIKVNLKVADILKFAHKYEGEDFISFEVARMQQPYKFGRQYTVYVNSLLEQEEEQGTEDPAGKKKTKRKQKVEPGKDDEMLL
jgi:hypothetical protein